MGGWARSAARVGRNLSSSVEKVFYTLFMFNTSVLRVPLRYKGLVLGWFSPVLSLGQRIGAIGAHSGKFLDFKNVKTDNLTIKRLSRDTSF